VDSNYALQAFEVLGLASINAGQEGIYLSSLNAQHFTFDSATPTTITTGSTGLYVKDTSLTTFACVGLSNITAAGQFAIELHSNSQLQTFFLPQLTTAVGGFYADSFVGCGAMPSLEATAFGGAVTTTAARYQIKNPTVGAAFMSAGGTLTDACIYATASTPTQDALGCVATACLFLFVFSVLFFRDLASMFRSLVSFCCLICELTKHDQDLLSAILQ
jgi:hypothetical protein